MSQEAKKTVKATRLKPNEEVTDVEAWGGTTHGVHPHDGRQVDLDAEKKTIYWYRVTVVAQSNEEDHSPEV